jgi:hypothetical protein
LVAFVFETPGSGRVPQVERDGSPSVLKGKPFTRSESFAHGKAVVARPRFGVVPGTCAGTKEATGFDRTQT